MPSKGDKPIEGFQLEQFLGRGGFGEVWRAAGPGGVACAMKFINLSGKQGLKEFRAIERVKHIRHPNLLSIMAFWMRNSEGDTLKDTQLVEIDPTQRRPLPIKNDPLRPVELVLAMPLGDKNLADRLDECQAEGYTGIPPDELLTLLEDAARALDYLGAPRHDLGDGRLVGLQHCDIKPQNVMIVGDAAQVCDFGLIRVLGDNRLSTTGSAGSPAYIAPECITPFNPSNTTDQYSLAISYVELRTGRLPFEDQTNIYAVLNSHRHGRLDLSSLPAPEQDVIRRATAVNPAERFPSAQEMVRALRLVTAGTNAWAGLTALQPETVQVGSLAETLDPALHSPVAGGGYGPAPTMSHTPAAHEMLTPSRAGDLVNNSVGMRFVYLPSGLFTMGADEPAAKLAALFRAPEARFLPEHPAHPVRLSRSFLMSIHPVTKGQFARFVQEARYRTEPERDGQGGYGYHAARRRFEGNKPQYSWRYPGWDFSDEHPVVNVTWNDAAAFCRWLGRREGAEYRLPTEAEWEYACRAGTSSRYWFGDDPEGLAAVGNVADASYKRQFPKAKGTLQADDGYIFTSPVGVYRANPWGLYDPHGNVWEWTQDIHGEYPADEQLDPTGPDSGKFHVVRGGSWASPAHDARSASRDGAPPNYRRHDLGFRVVRVLPP